MKAQWASCGKVQTTPQAKYFTFWAPASSLIIRYGRLVYCGCSREIKHPLFFSSSGTKKLQSDFLEKCQLCQYVSRSSGEDDKCAFIHACAFVRLSHWDFRLLASDAHESLCLQGWGEETRKGDRGKETERRWEDGATPRFSSPFAAVRCNQACDRICVWEHLYIHESLKNLLLDSV